MRVFLWHVHGSWTTAFVQGGHDYVVPVLADRGPDGRGRARTWDWPANVVEVDPRHARDLDVDVVVVQRPEELDHLVADWLGRRPGRDVPAVYLEHNAPQGRIADMAHPAIDRPELCVVHVTHFNRLFWDTGTTPATVIEHGVIDPGYRYSGEREAAVAVINEPVRRGRVTGTDLLARLREVVAVQLYGMRSEPLGGTDVPQHRLHEEMARHRVYLHPVRWTSLGLSLIEAMHLGLPVVAVATTEVPHAVPPDAGVVSNRPEVLGAALARLVHEPDEARAMGEAARRSALARYGLGRFLDDWDRLLAGVAG